MVLHNPASPRYHPLTVDELSTKSQEQDSTQIQMRTKDPSNNHKKSINFFTNTILNRKSIFKNIISIDRPNWLAGESKSPRDLRIPGRIELRNRVFR